MPNIIIIRIHPTEPTAGDDFTAYLSGLTLIAYDLSFEQQGGQEIGRASYDPDRSKSRIVQHFRVISGVPPIEELFPVATAVIEVNEPIGWPEHRSSDIKLGIERGSQELRDRNLHYNITIISRATLPTPSEYDDLEPVGAYLALPPPGVGLDPGDPDLGLPADGSPPSFSELRSAVDKVLARDPGITDPPDITRLTPAQCRHIAYELVYNQQADPLPVPVRPLEDLYDPAKSTDLISLSDRTRFEAEVAGYYATHNAESERLARYIYAMSAALFCEARSRDAARVGFRFPIHPGDTDGESRIREAEVILTE
ncbi:hypothetical protein [Haliangium sp.]|uniref:hypothetical protein n=1 Tax=Haliangium sp. TaxID=2663208 RepID=UPI003D0AA6E3